MDLSGLDLSETPSGMPPPGQVPNFVNPPSRAPIANVFVTLTLALMIIFVAVRFYADVWVLRKLEKAGWVSLVAMAASISYCSVFYLTLSQHILGRHIWDVPVSMNSNSSVQNFTVLNLLYGPVEFLAKLSVLFLYLRVFGVDKRTRILTYIAMAINFALCLIDIIGYAIVCVPSPGQSWELADAKAKCEVTGDLLGVVTAAINIFNDFFVIAIPIPAVWSLQLATKRKIGVSAIFLTGLLVCIVSILNLVYRVRLWKSPQHDNTWNGAISYMLCVVEINVAIMCSCMPSIAACVNRHKQLFSSLRSHLRINNSWSFSFRKHGSKSSRQSDNQDMIGAERLPSTEEDARHHDLTLGSAVRDGKFLKTGDRSQFVMSQYIAEEDQLRSGEHHQPGKTPKQTARGDFELRSFSDGSVDNEKVSPGASMV